ncbi:hypothetical protein BDR26DRAFT_940615 [Obelidium mucronatum]|nr:hypothetical protein BDR26DRAFT_940615 [Obelidium mucronatum]
MNSMAVCAGAAVMSFQAVSGAEETHCGARSDSVLQCAPKEYTRQPMESIALWVFAAMMSFQAVLGAEETHCGARSDSVLQCASKEYTRQPMESIALWVFAAMMSFQAVSGAEEVSSLKGAIYFPYERSHGFQNSLWCGLQDAGYEGGLCGQVPRNQDYGTWRILHSMAVWAGAAVMSFQAVSGAEETHCGARSDSVLQCAPKEYTRQPMESIALWVFAAMMSFQAVSGAEEVSSLKGAIYFPYERSHGFQNSLWCGLQDAGYEGGLCGQVPRNQDYGTWRILHSMAVWAGAAVMSFQAVSGAEETHCGARSDSVLQCAPKEYTRQPMESIALWVFAAMMSFQAVSGAEEVSSLKGAIYFPYERSHGFQNSLWCGLQDAGYEGGLCGQVPRNQDYGTWRILHSMAVWAGAAVMSFQAVSGAEETHCGARSDSVLQCAPKEYTRQPMESIALWVFAAMMSFQAVSGAEEVSSLKGAIYFPYERSHGFQNSLWCGLQDAGYEGGLCGQVPRNQDYGTWRLLHSMAVCAGAAVMSFQAVSGAEETHCGARSDSVLQCAPKEYTRQPMESIALWVFAAMMSFQAVSGAEEVSSLKGAIYFPYERSHGFQNSLWCGLQDAGYEGGLCGQVPRNQDYGTWRILHSMAVWAGAAVMSFQAVSGAEETHCGARSDSVLQCAPKEYTRQPMESIALWVFAAMMSFQAVSGAEEVSSLKGAIYFPYERSHGFQNSLWCGLQDAGYEGGLCGQVPRNQDYGTWRILHSMAVWAGAAVMSFQAVSGAEETHCGVDSEMLALRGFLVGKSPEIKTMGLGGSSIPWLSVLVLQ